MFPPHDSKAEAADMDPPQPQRAKLTVTKTIRAGDEQRAQVLVCSIEPELHGNQPGFVAAAKIFDPLYYSFRCYDSPSVPQSVTREAEADYCVEAVAYEHLVKAGQTGSFALE